ncbi:hypothetical protein HK105_208678 [Polyrhizophydium stewartii]|uniref:Glutaredoxin-like protein n=1 Tax=Polyrhizophydium stewartii TaxID=2732419 RepID=A0ABR4MX49_9FUNG
MSRHRLVLFGRQYCGLCEHAKEVILGVRAKVPFEFDEVDIDKAKDRQWLRKYMFDVPVVHVNGAEVFRHRVEPAELERALRAAQTALPPTERPADGSK